MKWNLGLMSNNFSFASTSPPKTQSAGMLSEGAVFGGRYRIVRLIKSGGMGAVYEAVHLETERRRALKVMHPHLFQSDEMRERFKREARIASQVESEFIVDVSDAGIDEATHTPFMVMELLSGEDLEQRLKRLGRLSPDEALTYLRQAATALDKTHAKSIVHRDLKPENVFLSVRDDGSPRVKILDFGVAKLVASNGGTVAGGTSILGTPIYMAPEQFRMERKLSPAVDLYALGMMAFTLLVGKAYWSIESREAPDVIAFVMVAVQGPAESAVARAARWGVTLPPAFDTWFSKAAAPIAAHRFSSASEMIRELGAALQASEEKTVRSPGIAHLISGEVMAAGPSEPSMKSLQWPSSSKRNYLPWTIGIAGAGVVLTGIWLVQQRPADDVLRFAATAAISNQNSSSVPALNSAVDVPEWPAAVVVEPAASASANAAASAGTAKEETKASKSRTAPSSNKASASKAPKTVSAPAGRPQPKPTSGPAAQPSGQTSQPSIFGRN